MKAQARCGSGRLAAIAMAVLVLAGCGRKAAEKASVGNPLEALEIALVPETGDAAPDREIRRCQEKVRAGVQRAAWIERLGWAFVAKARTGCDAGYYKLAEICAVTLERENPGSPEGLLLRGHALDSMHRFAEAEPLARRLVATRGLSYDYALLGDVLMEQGHIQESIPAYQKAMDLRPDLHSYARAAYIRWLTGDLDGATELMRAAVGASSPVDAASVAWTCSRLAALDFQAGRFDESAKACEAALNALPGYPPALLLEGRMRLAAGDVRGALAPLEAAAEANPLPEPQWRLADALRADGRAADAARVEGLIRVQGASGDPRTLSLYLATRGQDAVLAVWLAEAELRQRQDVFTHDALAWALAAAGRLSEALPQMDIALGEGTEDGRLFFHAAVLADRTGDGTAAREWLARANALKPMLLPSERDQLAALERRLNAPGKTISVSEFIEGGKSKPNQKNKS